MSTAALLIGLALLVLTIPFVVEPIINEKKKKKFLADELDEEETGVRYQQILVALRDLDFDRQLDVVSDEDYSVLRTQLLLEAAQTRTVVELDKAEKEKLDAQIEAAVLTRRHSPVVTAVAATGLTCSQCGEKIDASDKFCAVCGTQTADFCPQCNRRIDSDDKFCAGCGLNLTTAMPREAAA